VAVTLKLIDRAGHRARVRTTLRLVR
jgi:hypothetical protein